MRGSRRCRNPFRLSSGGSNGVLFPFTPFIHFVFRFSQSQGHVGADRSRGRQRRERLQAGLGSPDGSAAGQLHRGVHREPHGAVRENLRLRAFRVGSSAAAPQLRHCCVSSSAPPSSEASEGTSAPGNLLCKLVAFSGAAPHLLACDCSEDYPQRSTERCKGGKKPSGGHGERERRGERLHIDYPPFLTAASSVCSCWGGRGGGVTAETQLQTRTQLTRLKIAFSTHASSRLKQIGCGLLAEQLNILLVTNS